MELYTLIFIKAQKILNTLLESLVVGYAQGNVQPVGMDEEKPTKPRCPGKYRAGWP